MVISFRLNEEQILLIAPIARKENKKIPTWIRESAMKYAKESKQNDGVIESTLNDADFFQLREIVSEELENFKTSSLSPFVDEMKAPVIPIPTEELVEEPGDLDTNIDDDSLLELESIKNENSSLKNKIIELESKLKKQVKDTSEAVEFFNDWQNSHYLKHVMVYFPDDEELNNKFQSLVDEAMKINPNLSKEILLENIIKNGIEMSGLKNEWSTFSTPTLKSIFRNG